MTRSPQIFTLAASGLCVLLWGKAAFGADSVDFNRDIRPILSDKCFKCHGPDAENQKSEFRIDSFEHATTDLGGYAGVVPGDLGKSEVHLRIRSEDGDDRMPPPHSKMALTPAEIDLLDRWIEGGAGFEKLWSFQPVPPSVDPPAVEDADGWARNEIDAFILARLEEENFAPSSETSREKWLRRVTFDLTGLPPTLAELDAFLADDAPGAHERVVDRLFATDAHAERLASEWLDVARYSDSYGFQVDRDRRVWPWRDWVIRAFARNLPHDQFIVEQLAGDLLPDAGREQILATAFNRLHPQKVEGGSVPEEFRVEYVSDRVHTYGTAFLGLTLECSRCHDHKYDPVTARDYYSLSAFFANIDEAGLYSFFTQSVPTPTLWLPDEKEEDALEKIEARIAATEARLGEIAASSATDEAFARWQRQRTDPVGESVPPPGPLAIGAPGKPYGPIAAFSFDQRREGKKNHRYPDAAEGGKPATTVAANRAVEGRFGQAVQLSGDDPLTLPLGNFTRDQPFAISLWMKTPDRKERAVIFSRSKAWTDAASRGYELLLEEGNLSAALIHFSPGNALRVRATEELAVDRWHHIVFSYDGSSRADGLRLFLDGEAVATETVRDKLTRKITGGGLDHLVIGQRMRDSGFKNGLVDEFLVYDRALSLPEARSLFTGDPLDPEEARSLFLATEYPPYRKQLATLTNLREGRSALVDGIDEIMVMREQPEPRQSYLLERGGYDNRGEAVRPDTPAALPAFPEDVPRDRLGLARWTVSPDNPLTARVVVNRYWQMFFGRGLVATSEDFGNQGQSPTHPRLLDWLARDFIDHGWDLRHLLKQIVLSATYRQRSDLPSGDLLERDPENEWLARFPANRLPAEMIRDNALAVSGLLVDKVGGPPVKPYEIAQSFKPAEIDEGDGLHRRSLYTYWRQTAPAPLMTTLNASKRDVCRVRREKTDSPLQGLVLLNSPQFAEAARVLAARLLEKHGDAPDAIAGEAFRLLTSRRPDERECKVLRKLLAEQREIFSGKPEEAAELVSAGAAPPATGLAPAEHAAVTVLVATLMNYDETVSKR